MPGVPGCRTGAVCVCVAVRTMLSRLTEPSFFATASRTVLTKTSGNCKRSSETKVVVTSPDLSATTLAVSGVSRLVESRRPNCPHRATALFGVMSTDAAPTFSSAPCNTAGSKSQATHPLHAIFSPAQGTGIFIRGSLMNRRQYLSNAAIKSLPRTPIALNNRRQPAASSSPCGARERSAPDAAAADAGSPLLAGQETRQWTVC